MRIGLYSHNHIDMVFMDDLEVDKQWLIGYYDFPEKTQNDARPGNFFVLWLVFMTYYGAQ